MSGLSCFRSFALATSLLVAWSSIAQNGAFAAQNPAPVAPTAPPTAQARKIPENPFRCDRLIRYRGKNLPCDSALRRDGESLRSIYENTPEALEELDRYQAGRKSLAFAAYTGTAGIILALTSGILPNLFIDESDPEGRQKMTRLLRASGIGMTVGGVVFGYSFLRSNEDHLQQSILKYNAAQPDRPIEILFKTEF